VLARARRFDRRVQGEEVGLAGDTGDRIHELSDLARAQLQRSGGARHLVQVVDEGHEQLAGPRDLLTMALRLLRHAGDLTLGFCARACSCAATSAAASESSRPWPMSCRWREVPSVSRSAAGRDLLRRGLKLLCGGGELLSMAARS